jgi:hypothetical protein
MTCGCGEVRTDVYEPDDVVVRITCTECDEQFRCVLGSLADLTRICGKCAIKGIIDATR